MYKDFRTFVDFCSKSLKHAKKIFFIRKVKYNSHSIYDVIDLLHCAFLLDLVKNPNRTS